MSTFFMVIFLLEVSLWEDTKVELIEDGVQKND